MSNSTYKGVGQAVTGNGAGLLARLGSIFGGLTPTYRGDGQPSAAAGGFFGAVTPRYKDSSKEAPSDAAAPCGDAQAPRIVVVDGGELAAGKIAIVVPRDLCAQDASAIEIPCDPRASDPNPLGADDTNEQQQQ